jgi:dTDP-glucose 4,6-dehydratase
VAEHSRVLVTGGAGFIGANFVHHAARAHPAWEIVVLDKLTYAGNRANLAAVEDRIEFVHGDIADPAVVDATMAGCDAVLNFAAESHVDRSLVDCRPFVRTNVEGTAVLLGAAQRHGVKRFLHVSTDEVYGDLAGTDHCSLESDVLAPRSPYAASKTAAEHLVFSWGISFGLDVVVTRGSNTYGPYQYPEKIIPLFITNAVDELPLPIYGRGEAVRDYLHVEDHCAGIDTVLHAGETGTAYNLGARLEVNGLEVAERILDGVGRDRSLMTYVTDRPGHDYRYAVNPGRAEALGWTRRHEFPGGMASTIAWYLENEAWWRAIKESRAYGDHERTWYRDREK